MNITRNNFNEQLPGILAAIDGADFVALDLEFTGLPDDGKLSKESARSEKTTFLFP